MATFLFRVDVGPGVGLGHLSRCVALANGLSARGASSVFLVPPEGETSARSLAVRHTVEVLASSKRGSAEDLDETIAAARRHGGHDVVVDSYAVDAHYLGRLREAGFFVTFIDDLAREAVPAHVVVNGGAQAAQLPHRSSTHDTQFLLGPEYVLLRSECLSRVSHERGRVEQVLITVGGDDPLGATSTLIELLDGAPGDFAITATVGPFSLRRHEVEAAAARARRTVMTVDASTGLSEFIARADLAVSAAGQTLYELAACGLPTIAVELFDNQARSLAALADAGVVRSAGRWSDAAFASRLLDHVADLIGDPSARAGLRLAGTRLVDGHGADRVAAVLCEAR